MSSDENIYFARLSDLEFYRNVDFIIQNGISALIWEKGEKNREKIDVKSYSKEFGKISFKLINKNATFTRDELLLNFSIKGVHFFAKGRVTLSLGHSDSVVALDGEFFKCERRKGFRLAVGSNSDTYCVIDAKTNFGPKERIKIKEFRESLAKNKDMQEQILASILKEGFPDTELAFKLYDISVGGLAIVMNEKENIYFTEEQEINNLKIVFDDNSFVIPMAKITFLGPYKGPRSRGLDSKLSMIKVGVQFLEVPTRVDDQLGRLIKKHIKQYNVKRAFEKFFV